MPMTQAQFHEAQETIRRGCLFTFNGRTAFSQEGLDIIVQAEGIEGQGLYIADDPPAIPQVLPLEDLEALSYGDLGKLCSEWGLLVPAKKLARIEVILEAQNHHLATMEPAATVPGDGSGDPDGSDPDGSNEDV